MLPILQVQHVLKQKLVPKGISVLQAEEYSQIDGELALDNATRLAEKYVKNKLYDLKPCKNCNAISSAAATALIL